MPRLVIYVSDDLQNRLRERAEIAGTAVSSLGAILLDQALAGYGNGHVPALVTDAGKLWEPDETIAPSRPERTPPAAPAPKPKAPEKMPKSGGLVMPGAPREPHVMKNRFAEKCETLDLVDGVCPTCGYRDA